MIPSSIGPFQPRLMYRRWLIGVFGWAFMVATDSSATSAQTPPGPASDADAAVTNADAGVSERMEGLLDDLRSDAFTRREHAMTALLELGEPIATPLGRRLKTERDPEVRMRLAAVLAKLRLDHLDTRLDRYGAGEDVDLPALDLLIEGVPDDPRRRPYVRQMFEAHREVLLRIDRDPNSATQLAMRESEKFVQPVQGRFVSMPPSAVVLLLSMSDDRDDPAIASRVNMMLYRLGYTPAKPVSPVAWALQQRLREWLPPMDDRNRAGMLDIGLHHGVDAGLPAARDTLKRIGEAIRRKAAADAKLAAEKAAAEKAAGGKGAVEKATDGASKKNADGDPDDADRGQDDRGRDNRGQGRNQWEDLRRPVVPMRDQRESATTQMMALATLARFGETSDLRLIDPLLDGDEVISPDRFVGNMRFRNDIGDYARATVALIAKKPLAKVGFTDGRLDPIYGFSPASLMRPVGSRDRNELTQTARQWIAEALDKPETISDDD